MSERFAWIYDKTRKAKIWCADMWSRKAILAIKAQDDASNLCNIVPTVPTLDAGTHSSAYGGCWYYKIGHRVRVHIGVSGLTQSTKTTLWTLPAGYRPFSAIAFDGQASSYSNYARFRISTAGEVIVHSGNTSAIGYAEFDAFS